MVTPVRHDLSDPAIPEGMVRISAGAEHRFIWPVHLGGWQSLGWQLQEAAAELPVAPTVAIDLTAPLAPEPEEVAQPLPAVEPAAVPEAQSDPEPQPEPEPAAEPKPDVATAPVPAPDFQAMTKAQILEHCSSVYGVELDGSATKAELVEQATALAQLPVELLDGPSHP